MRYYKTLTLLACSLLCCIATQNLYAQPPHHGDKPKFRERIEDLRKVKLIDVLGLQGEQVEKFFGTYNRLQKRVLESKDAMDAAARELYDIAESNASESDTKTKTDNLLTRMKDFENAINARHAEVRPLLTAQQYARYLAFEVRFQEDLQKQIIQRARKFQRD